MDLCNAMISLPADEVHLWYLIPQRLDPAWVTAFLPVLGSDERAQLESLANPNLARDYLIARGMVRRVLSRYADSMPPERWEFTRNSWGRPAIANPGFALRFNLTHCYGWMGCVVALGRDIGVDAEDSARALDFELVARQNFSHSESAWLRGLAPELRRRSFFELWTLKEAFVKARGLGLSLPLDQFSFELTPGAKVRIRCEPSLKVNDPQWQFELLRPTARHQVAVAIRRDVGADLKLVSFEFGGHSLGTRCLTKI